MDAEAESINGREMKREGLLRGARLREALGFGSSEAFRAAAREGRMPVKLFKIPGRQGWWARASEVDEWLRTVDQRT